MECRKLDGNARSTIDATPGGRLADGVDRLLVVAVVALGVLGSRRRFAQHVIGILEALGFERSRAADGFLDGLAGDELLAHHAHRHIDAATYDRLSGTGDQLRQRGRQAPVVDSRGQLTGDDQAPGRGIDEKRPTAAEMRFPIAGGDLVADQRIACRRVGNAQQRFGKAHQRHAFLAGEGIFLHQSLNACTLGFRAQRLDQSAGRCFDRLGFAVADARRVEKGCKAFWFRAAIGCGDRLAERALFSDLRCETVKNANWRCRFSQCNGGCSSRHRIGPRLDS